MTEKFTKEQRQAIAIANARLRVQEDDASVQPEESVQTQTENKLPYIPRLGAPDYPDDLGGIRQYLQGASLGMADELGASAAALAATALNDAPFMDTYKDMRDLIRIEDAMYRQNHPVASVTQNIIGGITTSIPALQSFLGSAVAGGAAGYGFSEKEDALGQAKDAAFGSVVGMIGQQAVSKVGGYVMKRLNSKYGMARLLDENGKVREEVIEAIEDEVAAGNVSVNEATQTIDAMGDALSPDALKRFNLFKSRGITPLRANVTQSTDDWRALQSSAKKSGKVADTLADQDDQMISAVRGQVESMRPSSGDIIETNANVYRVIDDVTGQYEDAVSSAYAAAREAAEGQKVVKYEKFIAALKSRIGDDSATNGAISSIRQELKNQGILSKGWLADKRTDVLAAEQIRKHLNSLHDPKYPYRNQVIRELKQQLDEDVASVVPEDVFRPAREANVRLKQLIQRSRRNKRDGTRGGFLEDVLSNRIPEEKIVTKLLTGRDDDFLKFKQFLTEDAGDAGVSAWNDVRAQVLREALDKATSTTGKGEGGQIVFNSRLFRNSLSNLRRSKKFDALFTADEQQLIDDIIDIGYHRIPISRVQQGEGPTELAVDTMRRAIAYRLDKQGGLLERLSGEIAASKDAARQLNPLTETAAVRTRMP